MRLAVSKSLPCFLDRGGQDVRKYREGTSECCAVRRNDGKIAARPGDDGVPWASCSPFLSRSCTPAPWGLAPSSALSSLGGGRSSSTTAAARRPDRSPWPWPA